MRIFYASVYSIISLLMISCAQTSTVAPILAHSIENELTNYVYTHPSAVPSLSETSARIIFYRPQSTLR